MFFLASLFFVHASAAEPIINDIPMPPASFTMIDDQELLIKIGLDPGPAWCYDVDANSVIITAPARERAKCELKLLYETEKQKVKSQFEIDRLKLRIDSLNSQHSEILKIKDQEIERLTDAALKRPNDYSVWWATGGFLTGILTTIAIVGAL